MEKLLLKPGEAAVVLGVSRSKLYALLRCRILPTVQLGKRTLVPSVGLRQWVESQTRDGLAG